MPPETRLSYYYSFICPNLSYNIASWGKAHECILKPLITAQKRIIRTIDGAQYREHTNQLFLICSLLKLNEIYSYIVCIINSHIINSRNRDQMQPAYQRLAMSQQAISFSAPKEWNKLPDDIRKTQTIGRLNKLLKTHLLSLYRWWITVFYIRSV